jgi:carbonic anhydrase
MARNPLKRTLPQKTASVFAPRNHVATNITAEDAAIMAQQHKPEAFLVCCIDSRFQPAKILDYGPGIALEHRPIACVIPPEEQASPDLLARMAFRRLNNVATIALVCHSDCGGAQAALKVPRPDQTTGGDLHAVAAAVHQSGLDLGRLGRKFLTAEKGDLRRAGDRLAREVGVQSLRNLMNYKGRDDYATVRDEVDAGALNVTLLYYDLEKRGFEVYDAWRGRWRAAANAETLFTKPQRNCAHPACHSH